jgi:hypothetical protein
MRGPEDKDEDKKEETPEREYDRESDYIQPPAEGDGWGD